MQCSKPHDASARALTWLSAMPNRMAARAKSLLEGLEVIRRVDSPRRSFACDLDAALAFAEADPRRRARAHQRRGLAAINGWQDIEELLKAGIDVYTTVNVQHLESLNDVVAQITGVVVRETIPDAVLEQVDELELIDITPKSSSSAVSSRQGHISPPGGTCARLLSVKPVGVA